MERFYNFDRPHGAPAGRRRMKLYGAAVWTTRARVDSGRHRLAESTMSPCRVAVGRLPAYSRQSPSRRVPGQAAAARTSALARECPWQRLHRGRSRRSARRAAAWTTRVRAPMPCTPSSASLHRRSPTHCRAGPNELRNVRAPREEPARTRCDRAPSCLRLFDAPKSRSSRRPGGLRSRVPYSFARGP